MNYQTYQHKKTEIQKQTLHLINRLETLKQAQHLSIISTQTEKKPYLKLTRNPSKNQTILINSQNGTTSSISKAFITQRENNNYPQAIYKLSQPKVSQSNPDALCDFWFAKDYLQLIQYPKNFQKRIHSSQYGHRNLKRSEPVRTTALFERKPQDVDPSLCIKTLTFKKDKTEDENQIDNEKSSPFIYKKCRYLAYPKTSIEMKEVIQTLQIKPRRSSTDHKTRVGQKNKKIATMHENISKDNIFEFSRWNVEQTDDWFD